MNIKQLALSRKHTLRIMLVVFVIAMLVAVIPAAAATRTFTATLTGEAEVPSPGDPDGSGRAKVSLNPSEGEVCFKMVVNGIAPATAAHIHVGTADVAGPIVVPLTPPTDGFSSGCVSDVDADLIRDIGRNPSNYYVNVHNADFPGGALRGQLSR